MMLAGTAISNFRDFLIISWPSILEVLETMDWDEFPYFLEEWMQANWELLVEKQVLEEGRYLEPYGCCKSPECRHLDQGKLATHRVVCKDKNQCDGKMFIFLWLVARIDGTYKIAPPFDVVDVRDIVSGETIRLAYEEVAFSIQAIQET